MSEGTQRRFGRTDPAGGDPTYGGYLQLPELLSLQQLLSDLPVHDELLFVVVHQAYELWFKQLLFELGSVRDRLFEGDTERARHYLTRVHAIERVLIEHIEVLETMSPQDFLAFREHLAPASVPIGAVPRARVPERPEGRTDAGRPGGLAGRARPAGEAARGAHAVERLLLTPRVPRPADAGG